MGEILVSWAFRGYRTSCVVLVVVMVVGGRSAIAGPPFASMPCVCSEQTRHKPVLAHAGSLPLMQAPHHHSHDSRKFHSHSHSDKSIPNRAPVSESGSLAQLEERRSHTFV